MTAVLPLFLNEDLKGLRNRREALLNRLKNLRPHEHRRLETIGELKAVTSQILILEQKLGVRRG